jgi:hypothetical protein
VYDAGLPMSPELLETDIRRLVQSPKGQPLESGSSPSGEGRMVSAGTQTPGRDLAVLGSEIHAAACFTLRLPYGLLVGGWLTDPV